LSRYLTLLPSFRVIEGTISSTSGHYWSVFSSETKILSATRSVRRRHALTFQAKRNNDYFGALPARVLA
jgi:hypothetical protein